MDEVPERIKNVHDVKDIASLCHFAYSLTMAFGDSWNSDPLRVHLLVTARKLVVSEVEGAPHAPDTAKISHIRLLFTLVSVERLVTPVPRP